MPKAYLGVLFFDERLNFIAESSSLIRVSQQGDGATPLVLGNIRAPRNGYAYVYVSNESNEPVFFDDLKVQHRRSALLEETHYYPFGLTMAGISSKKLGDINEGRLKNQYQYQGEYAEYDDETSWNDFELRSYDAQIGRFVQADPYDQFASPYTGMGNDPMNLVDPSGGIAIPCPGSISALSGIMSQVSTMTMILGVTSNALQITSTVTAQQTVMSVGKQGPGLPSKSTGAVLDGQRSLHSEVEKRQQVRAVRQYYQERNKSWHHVRGNEYYNSFTGEWRADPTAAESFAWELYFLPGPKFLKMPRLTKEAGTALGIGVGVVESFISREKAIVIGEGMESIMNTAKSLRANGVNAKWYQAWSKNFPANRLMTKAELDAALERNARWINSKIDQGYKIYDIGIDASRATRSPFYHLEQGIIQQRNYPVIKLPR